PALVSIMARLAALADPLIHEDDTCILALSLINIALETMSDVDSLAVNYPRLLSILQNDLCRNLLRLSTASDLTILGLSLRVIFNLFNGIKDHLKVQLEVFLTSVHLRILSSSDTSFANHFKFQLALESLLEFCREPMLMQDLYINYDCDINCTNLFESECPFLFEDIIGRPRLNILNRLALEGVIAVIDSIARRCRASSNLPQTPLSHREDDADADMNYLSRTKHQESLVLRERKIKKRRLAKAAAMFNECSRDKEWLVEAERLGVITSPATADSVAHFLYHTPKLDKVKIGSYISKGPPERYPFIADVLKAFAGLFDFRGMSFSDALRVFLSRFRLPGEAQCIDRLMEAFAARLRTDSIFPFKSADACFILAFSTIMLNTDLHNPNMDDAKRMTIDQFVRNNRGINDGEDLPTDFLKSLYYEINNEEIQVKQDTQDGLGKDGDFDGLLANAADVATPFYTSTNSAHNNYVSVHDRDMFISISSAAIEAVSTVYVHSWDDALVAKALDGLKNAANICVCFGLHQQFNEILQLLLSWGGDYEALVESSYEASNNVAGSAAHRGLLSLDCALTLCKNHLSSINEALPALLDVVFALRDVDALPERLGDLDDFADSHGEPLPPSSFANSCREVVTKYKDSAASSSEQSSPLQKVLQKVSKKASLDQIILKTNDVVLAKRVLSAMLMAMYPDEDADIFTADPLFEHNASFVLELAARLLISNRAHSSEMLPIFLSRFEALLSPQTNQSTGETEIIGLKHPYLVERIVVTILRACIHLYDIPETCLRQHLNRSLELISKLPVAYTREISDRLSCGAAIILRGCFFLFDTAQEWDTIKHLL
ncbi:guanyl nucleotide exchange factor, partial [Thalassiosira pseudonana CCMP1335]